ncbi:hypothetical protein DL96DRAFT_1705129 [Flagelloscypha sp. PMI_526]|nr:hypothetical protein DL96DRAFT_1705129 [Flagelloscypha sp. PMI_526]
MHNALLIDEVQRQIFRFCTSQDLAHLASCTHAFLDAALDLRWRDLSSIVGLLLLIPGVELQEGVISLDKNVTSLDLARFETYSVRVRSIAYSRKVTQVDVRLSQLLSLVPTTLLPHLGRVSFRPKGFTPTTTRLSNSPALQCVQLDTGFFTTDGDAGFIQQLKASGVQLRQMSIRGPLSLTANEALSSFTTVETLSLRLGTSLTPEAFLSVLSFPVLRELDVHATHLNMQELQILRPEVHHTAPILSSLKILRIRGSSDLIQSIISRTIHLHTLHIELDDSLIRNRSWKTMIDLIGSRCHHLEALTIEHHLDLDAEQQPTPPIAAALPQHTLISAHNSRPSTPGPPAKDGFELSLFYSLKSARSLRHLSLDTTIPFVGSDQDIVMFAKYWPCLEHLDLGATSSHVSSSDISLRSLHILATALPRLQSLILPIGAPVVLLNSLPLASTPVWPSLERLTLPTAFIPDVVEMTALLGSCPLLRSLDGHQEHEEAWEKIRASLYA